MRVALRVGDDGQTVLDADEVGEPPNRASGAEKVAEFRRTLERGGVENYMRVDVPLVYMGADDICVPAL